MATKEAYRLTRVSVLGVPVSVFSLDDIDDVLSALLAGERFQQVVFISLWDLLRARRNRRFGQMVRDAAMVVPTSRSICRAARFLGKSQPEAYQPFEFVIRILGALERRGGTLYVLGLHRKSLQTADFTIRQTYPGLRLVGRHQGYFGHERESDHRIFFWLVPASRRGIDGSTSIANRWGRESGSGARTFSTSSWETDDAQGREFRALSVEWLGRWSRSPGRSSASSWFPGTCSSFSFIV